MIRANWAGVLIGFSFFFQNCIISTMFLIGGQFMKHANSEGKDIWVVIFVVFFGSIGAGMASQFGPQIGKAMKAGMKIFMVMDQESEIDVRKESAGK